MATITDNRDGTLTVTITQIEQTTLDASALDTLAQYLTIWLADRASVSFSEKFKMLSPQDQADILMKFRGV